MSRFRLLVEVPVRVRGELAPHSAEDRVDGIAIVEVLDRRPEVINLGRSHELPIATVTGLRVSIRQPFLVSKVEVGKEDDGPLPEVHVRDPLSGDALPKLRRRHAEQVRCRSVHYDRHP